MLTNFYTHKILSIKLQFFLSAYNYNMHYWHTKNLDITSCILRTEIITFFMWKDLQTIIINYYYT